MAAEMDVIWLKYRKRKLLFQSKQDKESDLQYIAEIRGKAEFAELRELISKEKKCRHCDAEDPLTLEDVDNLLLYLVIMGLKNNDLIDYLF